MCACVYTYVCLREREFHTIEAAKLCFFEEKSRNNNFGDTPSPRYPWTVQCPDTDTCTFA